MTRVTKWETWSAAAVSWLSAALLVWTAHSNLAAWVFQEVGEHQRFTLVVDRTLKNPRSTGHNIWFREVLVDGHHLLSRDILVEGAWKALGERGYHAAAPATASFTGRSAVVELLGTPEAGIAKVRDNRREALVDAYSPWTFMVHGDLPVWTRPWWSWALFIAPVLGSIVFFVLGGRGDGRMRGCCSPAPACTRSFGARYPSRRTGIPFGTTTRSAPRLSGALRTTTRSATAF